MIPRIIHQTWKDQDVPERFLEAQRSWREVHPEWEYRFWTDEDLETLVRERAPELMSLYERYPEAIQRVDAARYVILREFGGAYIDLDVQCLRPLDPLLEAEVVLARTTPFGVSNQFMLSVEQHSLFQYAVDSLPRAFAKWGRVWPRHVRVLTTAGPLFMTGRLKEHGTQEGMRILTLDEHGHGDPEMAYVGHLRGNTWAAWDTHVINFFHDNWKWFAVGVAITAVLLGSLL
ncbi:MAG TPA: hypothetical protein EYQ64_15005 [Gemmatimonadetes bacterium]|nr:hypothetical protein [Gemmatimonadota bacterium]